MEVEIAKFLHDAGIALGVGGVTFQYLINIEARKDKSLEPLSVKLQPIFGKCIGAGLLLLIISGIWLNQIVSWPIDQNVLLAKVIVTVVLIVNAIVMNAYLRKKAPGGSAMMVSETFGLIIWWAIVIISVFL